MALDEPVVVVVIAEALEGLIQVFKGGEGMDPEKLLFERAPEPLDATVAFGGADEGGAGIHPEEAKLGLEGSGDKLGAVVMPKLQACSNGFVDTPEGRSTGLMERCHGLVAVRVEGGVNAHEFAGAMVVDAKDGGLLAIEKHGRGGVRAPHFVRFESGDRAIVGSWSEHTLGLPRRLKAVLTHEQPYTLAVGVNAAIAEAGMNLPIALPHERWVREHRADGAQEISVGHEWLGTRLGDWNRDLLLRPLGIDRGTGNAQFLADGRKADNTVQGSSHGHADHFRFPGMKGSSPLRSRSA